MKSTEEHKIKAEPMRLPILLFLVLAALFVTGCLEREQVVGEEVEETAGRAESGADITPIEDILASPADYADREVTLRGVVEPGRALQFIDEQPYMLRSEEGEALWVMTRDVMPTGGEELTVTGTVMVPYQLKGRSYDVAIIEKERRG